ncbi:uncharacterized protein N7483_007073 [Penicillium malachiteum]|uniref:uncharacterized protein n=1 Tax=Penicillium malachiteum TaxID=1324776 RepID=UPI0025473509|nr:uncharacterized protein N7483_007073 [Penicillium malachiteum]KAJ5725716.1 hypothetical protein N7483_007073 [Penicillium malachiteum]
MAPANDATFLRRNNQVQDAIDGQNFKQALTLIEKRVKKGEDTRFLKASHSPRVTFAWKANIYTLMADEAHRERGRKETLDICKAEPPTIDLDTLDLLFRTLNKMEGHAETKSLLWERAVKAKPQDEELQMRWFTFAYEDEDWKSAQKASMSLQKNFPRERKYYFWAIFCTYLLSVDPRSSEMECKLFGTLAYRMVSKAVEDVPTDSAKSSTPPRAIQNSEELLLLIKIFESQGRSAEIVKILNSQNVGISSPICQNDAHFKSLMAHHLGAANLWEEAITFVKEDYKIDENGRKDPEDNFVIWELLIKAVKHYDTPGAGADARKFVESHIDFDSKSRNAGLARLDLISVAIEKGEMTMQDDLVPACQQYIEQHKHKLYMFNDLRRVLHGDKNAMAASLQFLSKNLGEGEKALVPTINALKLDFCLNISAVEKPSKQSIDDFVVRCMNLYESHAGEKRVEKTEPTDGGKPAIIESQPRDELCILAAMAIGHESKEEPINDHLACLRATVVLERLLIDSPHNYQALLMIMRFYLLFGAGSLALGAFNKLSVKQMQYESVAHNFFTRLATIHPHSTPPVEGLERKEFDPQAALIQGLNFYRNADLTTMRYRSRGLDEGSYINVAELIELRKRLSTSICRRMYALDARRAQRLVGGDPLVRFDEIARSTAPTVDQRVYDAFMNCEFPGEDDFETFIRLGPLPKENWIATARITDRLFGVLKDIAIQRPLTPETDLPDLSALTLSEAIDLTEDEQENRKIHSELLKVATFMAGSKNTTAEQVDKALAGVEQWLSQMKAQFLLDDSKISPFSAGRVIYLRDKTPVAPVWGYFHGIFTLLETLKALSLLVASASRKGSKTTKLPKERVDNLAALVPELFELIRSNTRAMKQRLSAPGLLTTLMDITVQGHQDAPHTPELQDVFESVLGEAELELSCASLMESWEEALDGVLSVKL